MRAAALVVVASLIGVACGDVSEERSVPISASTTAVAESTAAADVSVPSVATTTSSDPPPTSTASTAAPSTPPVAGGDSAGDPYFVGLGNSGYDALSYDINLIADPLIDDIEATTTMVALATVSLSSFNLDLGAFEVVSVTVDGVDASFEHVDQELIVRPVAAIESGTTFETHIAYSGTPMAILSPSWRAEVGWLDAGDYSYVVSEPTGAHGWFPVNDHPIDKATYSISATVPNGRQVVANGVLESSVDNGDGTTTWSYVARDPMASYLVTIGIGEFIIHESISTTGTPLRDAYRPSVEVRAKPAIDLQSDMLEVFTDLFGPYPFEAYGALVVEDSFGGALETQTMSVFSGTLFGGSFGHIVVAHELAHQWFGNSLTPSTWQDIWLSEGFATYAEWLWLEATDPTYDIDVEAVQLANAGRRVWSPPGDPGAEGLFDSTVYNRGGLTLHALRRTIGDEVFFDVLRAYVQRHAYSNVDTADFVAVAEEVSGRDLSELFDAWLYLDTTPELPAD